MVPGTQKPTAAAAAHSFIADHSIIIDKPFADVNICNFLN
jgi:hypothetical protein